MNMHEWGNFHCDMKGDAFLWTTSCIVNFQWMNTMISWNSNSPDWAQKCTTHQPRKSQSIAIPFWTRRISEWQQAVPFLAILSTGTKVAKEGYHCSSKINLKTSNLKKLPSKQPPSQRGLGRCISKGICWEQIRQFIVIVSPLDQLPWLGDMSDMICTENGSGYGEEIDKYFFTYLDNPDTNIYAVEYSNVLQSFWMRLIHSIPPPGNLLVFFGGCTPLPFIDF